MALSEYILDVNEATFERDVIRRSYEVPVVVDFWAPWCGPCRMLGPILERLALEGGGRFLLAKVNVDDNPGLAMRYGVQGIPAVKAFRNGEVVAQFVGAQPEGRVRRFIEELAPSETDQALARAQALLAARKWAEAEQAFRDLLAKQEGNGAVILGLIRSLLMQGNGREALDLINDFPSSDEWVVAEKLKPLAELLAEVETREPPEDDLLVAELYQAGRLIGRGNLEAAMDGLIEILRQDKRYRDGLPHKVMLALFALLGDDDPVTRRYQQELASVLF